MNDQWTALNAIATLLLAAASVFVAVMSWRTARRANALTETAQERDRARSRRMIVLQVREWAKRADESALRGAGSIGELMREGRSLSERCRVEGEAEGVMLVDAIAARVKALHRFGLYRPDGWEPGPITLPPWTRRYPELGAMNMWAERPERVRQLAFDAFNDASGIMITESMEARARRRRGESTPESSDNQFGQDPVAD